MMQELLAKVASLHETGDKLRMVDPDASQQSLRQAAGLLMGMEPRTVVVERALAENLMFTGELQGSLGNLAASLELYYRASALYERVGGDPERIIRCRMDVGVGLAMMGHATKALPVFFKALDEARRNDLYKNQIDLLNNIGYALVEMDRPAEGLPYLDEAIKIGVVRAPDELDHTYGSLCDAHLAMGNLEDSLDSAWKAVDISRRMGRNESIAIHLECVGRVYTRLGGIECAVDSFNQAIEIARKGGFRQPWMYSLQSLGKLYLQNCQILQALEVLHQSLKLAETMDARWHVANIYDDLYMAYKAQQDFKHSLEYLEKHHAMRMEISTAQAEMRLQSLDLWYQVETANKEAELNRLKTEALERRIAEQAERQRFLEEMAHIDQLTRVYNRHYFIELAQQWLKRLSEAGACLGMVMIDLDHFKKVNDTLGHVAGDRVLKVFTERVQVHLRQTDVLGRWGGEEFTILLPETQLDDALKVAERVRSAVAGQPFVFEDQIVSVTISLGVVSVCGNTRITLDELIDMADHALYRAKEMGRNCVEYIVGE